MNISHLIHGLMHHVSKVEDVSDVVEVVALVFTIHHSLHPQCREDHARSLAFQLHAHAQPQPQLAFTTN